MDYFRGRKDAAITVYSNRTSPDTYHASYMFRPFEEMPKQEQKALKLCRGKVLDIGAGAGSHAIELQKRGLEVHTIDTSEGAVEVMRMRGIEKAIHQDIFEYKEERYDTLLMMMNGIGVAGNLDRLQTFLQHAHSLLKPKGQILFDSCDILYLYTNEDGSIQLNLNSIYYGTVAFCMEYEGVKGEPFLWLYVDPGTMKMEAERAHYSFELLYDSRSGYLARLTSLL